MIQLAVRRSQFTRRGFDAGDVFSSSEPRRVQINFDDWLNSTNAKLSQFKLSSIYFGVYMVLPRQTEWKEELKELTEGFKTEMRASFLVKNVQAVEHPTVLSAPKRIDGPRRYPAESRSRLETKCKMLSSTLTIYVTAIENTRNQSK
ncbi:MAG: hypothetical protein MHM6MM_007059 [Cercozoa sp. M6MM]